MQLIKLNCGLLLLLSLLAIMPNAAYRILFMGPFPAPSHWLWLEHFQRDLLRRGHHVTSVNNHPTKAPHANLTEIIITPSFDIPKHFPKKHIFSMRFASDFQNIQMWWKCGLLTSEHALQDAKVQSLIADKEQQFDLVILEQFFHESFLMFGYKYKCPVVTIGTMGYADNMDHAMGLLTPWSFIPHLTLPYTDQMTFGERAYNAYLSLYDAVLRRWYYMPKMQSMAEKYFAKHIDGPLPTLRLLERNISLMLINSHRSTDLPRPTMSRFVNVAGAHIQPAKPLPQSLAAFMSERNATHGVVYFSLGSYMKSTDMPAERTALILNAFAKLKQRVIWKYENESIGQLPENVLIRKWLPQNDILAHPNVKVFITHGGQFGIQEGIYWGVPMLCVPLFGDQHRNAIKSERAGYARTLVFSEFTVAELVQNIEALVTEPQYQRNAAEASRKFRDNPLHPLDEASYWIEYVVRYKGAAHLKSYGAFIPLHQYLLLDILACLFVVLFVAVWLPWRLFRKLRNHFASNSEKLGLGLGHSSSSDYQNELKKKKI